MSAQPNTSDRFAKVLREDLQHQERAIESLRNEGFDTRMAEDFYQRLRRLLADCVPRKGQ